MGTEITKNFIENFIDEDNRRRIFFCLFKQVTYSGSTNADKHFYEIRTRNGEEGASSFSGNGSCQLSCTGSGRAHQQNTRWNSCANIGVFFRVF